MFQELIYIYVLAILFPVMTLFFVWRGWARATIMRRIGDKELVASLTAQISPFRRQVKIILWLGAMTALLLALARPTWGVETDVIRTEGIQIVFAIDVSRSMDAQDVSPSRLERAKLDILDMVSGLEGNNFGLVLFAREAFNYMPLTNDVTAVDIFLDGISTSMISVQGTNIPAAIERSLAAFESRSPAQRVIVIATDGESHEGDALIAAQLAADENTIIYTIGYGTQEGSSIPLLNENGDLVGYQTTSGTDSGILVNSTLNVDLLQRVASATDGAFITGGSNFDVLVADIQRLEAGDIGEQIITKPIERFWIFVAIAVVLLSFEMILPETKAEV